eukprot:CAMPEP_0168770702 /NCGR_PEP_ID=MMETSP0725-20121227/3058_1 /TAXON_ID=265536 /ORGANISM="Amphiprora sp., Strain CCMP467" /LENGTH=210 /DNA_ID=CAMNT_0008820159 /DNA_START=6 /DNA_END=639 /DNA_ORIENTATION=+
MAAPKVSSSSLVGLSHHSTLAEYDSNALPSISSSLKDGDQDDFYLRYHVAQKGRQWLEFELLPNGKMRYANNINYIREGMVRREVFLSPGVMEEFKCIVLESGIASVDDSSWNRPHDDSNRTEIECKLGAMHIAFASKEIISMEDVTDSPDAEGLRIFYFLSLELKNLFQMLFLPISNHAHLDDRSPISFNGEMSESSLGNTDSMETMNG